jgi:hypothetical protein
MLEYKTESMDLRDEIAIMAMEALLKTDMLQTYSGWRHLAKDSYTIADAMIQARESSSTASQTRTTT